MSEFHCLTCLFLLETAVICTYWYEFHISLKSAPRYIHAMRPGRHYVMLNGYSQWSNIMGETIL